jgi:hypothetical protein
VVPGILGYDAMLKNMGVSFMKQFATFPYREFRLPSNKSSDCPADEGSSSKRKTLNREDKSFSETLVCISYMASYIIGK